MPAVEDKPRAERAQPFACTWRDGGGGATWVHLFGELDLDTAPRVQRALAAASCDARLIILDLRGLTFMDSAGMHVIDDAADLARTEGRHFFAVRGPVHVDRVFTLTGTRDHVEMFDLAPPSHPPRRSSISPGTGVRHDERY